MGSPGQRSGCRTSKWAGVLVCLALLAAYGLSLRWGFGWTGQWYGLGVGHGKVRLSSGGLPAGYASSDRWYFTRNRPSENLGRLGYGLQWPSTFSVSGTPFAAVLIPLWIPLVATGACTALVFRRDRLHRIATLGSEAAGGLGRALAGFGGPMGWVGRGPLFVTSLVLASVTAALWATSYTTHWVGTAPPWSCGLRHGKLKVMYFGQTTDGTAASRADRIDLAGLWVEHELFFDEVVESIDRVTGVKTPRNAYLRIVHVFVPLWMPMSLFCAWPAMVLVLRGPLLRRYRRRHGLCVHCGYDLRGSLGPNCPECGTLWEQRPCP